MQTTAMTSKGQVTVSKEVRQRLRLRQGSRIAFAVEGDHAVLRPAVVERLRRLRRRQPSGPDRQEAFAGANEAEEVIGLDTNVLARYFLAGMEPASIATSRQADAARRLIEGDRPLQVCKTVLLELEGVMRGLYGTRPAQFFAVASHLLALPQVTIEDRASVETAREAHRSGLDFADAWHHAGYRACAALASCDDRRFGRRAVKLDLRDRYMPLKSPA